MGHTGGVGIIVFPTELDFGNITVGYDIAKVLILSITQTAF